MSSSFKFALSRLVKLLAATVKGQLQRYEAALAEIKRKAALVRVLPLAVRVLVCDGRGVFAIEA
jgi:hypothetical protein